MSQSARDERDFDRDNEQPKKNGFFSSMPSVSALTSGSLLVAAGAGLYYANKQGWLDFLKSSKSLGADKAKALKEDVIPAMFILSGAFAVEQVRAIRDYCVKTNKNFELTLAEYAKANGMQTDVKALYRTMSSDCHTIFMDVEGFFWDDTALAISTLAKYSTHFSLSLFCDYWVNTYMPAMGDSLDRKKLAFIRHADNKKNVYDYLAQFCSDTTLATIIAMTMNTTPLTFDDFIKKGA